LGSGAVGHLPDSLRLVTAGAVGPAASLRAREGAARRTVLMLLVPTALLVATGLVMVFSASSVAAYAEYGSSTLFFTRQAAYAGVGALALVLLSRLPYAAWRRLAAPLFAATVLLLVLVLHPGVGTSAGGSARWIAIGPVTLQPSELAKLALVALTATILARKGRVLDAPAHLVLPLFPIAAVVCWLVMRQPDLGTTVILAGSVFLLLFVAGVRLRYLTVAAAVGAAVGLALIMGAAYRRARLLSFLSPWDDPQNAGYHLIQSYIALGSGGLFGVGLGASRQKWLYVPNAHTDFIFSILGEELGLIVALAVLALYGVLLYGGVRVAARAPDTFGRLLAAGIVAWLGLQAIVNLGAVTGMLPITGVPLPLLSYGGSSLVVTLAAIGILVNVARASAPASARGSNNGSRGGTFGASPARASQGERRRRSA
jgi:cell division protein FtsW